eukprot:scaffold358081_cov31-Prasinocladus_malaysianus.AAC.2
MEPKESTSLMLMMQKIQTSADINEDVINAGPDAVIGNVTPAAKIDDTDVEAKLAIIALMTCSVC